MAFPYTKRFGGGFVDLPSTTTDIDSTFLNAVEAALIALMNDVPLADEVPVYDNASGKFISQLPRGYEFGYDQITANVTVSSNTEATGTTVIACAPHTFDGSPVWVHFFSPRVIPGDLCFINLFEGATQICRLGEIAAAGAATVTAPVSLWYRMTPTAAAHTFTVSAIRSGVDGTIVAHAGGVGTEGPTFVRFIKA